MCNISAIDIMLHGIHSFRSKEILPSAKIFHLQESKLSKWSNFFFEFTLERQLCKYKDCYLSNVWGFGTSLVVVEFLLPYFEWNKQMAGGHVHYWGLGYERKMEQRKMQRLFSLLPFQRISNHNLWYSGLCQTEWTLQEHWRNTIFVRHWHWGRDQRWCHKWVSRFQNKNPTHSSSGWISPSLDVILFYTYPITIYRT